MSGSRERKRLLFLAEGATMAHFVRPLVLADSLDPADYEVHFYAPARYAQFLRAKPFVAGELATMPAERFLSNLAKGKPLFPTDVLRSYLQQDREIIQSVRPDLVVGDLRFSMPVSARLEGVRCAAVMNAYWSPWAKRYSIIPELPITRLIPPEVLNPVYRLTEPIAAAVHVAGVNRLRKENGIARVRADFRALYTEADYVLYPDVPEFIPTPGAPGNHSYVGICEWQASVAKPQWWDFVMQDRAQKIFVALGSSGPWKALPALLKAASRLGTRVLLASSGRKVQPMEGVFCADLLPYVETAALCDAVISHGGSSSVYPALRAGTSVLAIPSNADQQISAAVMANNGAGIRVRSEQATESLVFDALRRLLNEPAWRERAKYWSAVLQSWDSGRLFNEFIRRAVNEAK